MKWFRRSKHKSKKGYVTIGEAVAKGLIDPEAHYRAVVPPRSVIVDSNSVAWPSWRVWRVSKMEDYLGIPPERKSVRFRDVPQPSLRQVIDERNDEGVR